MAGKPTKQRNPAKSSTTGRLIFSVAAWADVSASASWWESERGRLGKKRGAHPGALGTGEADTGGKLAELGHPELVAEALEGRPRGLPGKAGRL